jgi:hypothetical protein
MRHNGHGGTFRYYAFRRARNGIKCPSTSARKTHAIPARQLEFEAQGVADALASLHGIDLEARLAAANEARRAETRKTARES